MGQGSLITTWTNLLLLLYTTHAYLPPLYLPTCLHRCKICKIRIHGEARDNSSSLIYPHLHFNASKHVNYVLYARFLEQLGVENGWQSVSWDWKVEGDNDWEECCKDCSYLLDSINASHVYSGAVTMVQFVQWCMCNGLVSDCFLSS